MPCVSSFLRYQTKCVIKFSFRQLLTSWTERLIFDHPLKQLYSDKNGMEGGNTKISTSEEQRKISKWHKSYFSLLLYIVKEDHLRP